MPQEDRHKNRTVPVEFTFHEDFSTLPYPGRYALIFLTSGTARGSMNGRPVSLQAPAVLCLNGQDEVKLVPSPTFAAQSFCFCPGFFDILRVDETLGPFTPRERMQTGLSLYLQETHTPIPPITPAAYPQLFEWFFVLGTEVHAQSDPTWVCRLKKYLIQILGLLELLNRKSEASPVDLVLEYLHTNYSSKITLADLTACAHLNRTTLNEQFRLRCGTTAMGYLLEHRLAVACDMLTHTGMSLNEIARATGFEYDTYFIKQFTAKKGVAPTAYRNASRRYAASV